MRSDPRDRLSNEEPSSGRSPLLLAGAVAVVGALALFLFRGGEAPPEAVDHEDVVTAQPVPAVVARPEPAPAPDIPRAPVTPEAPVEPTPAPQSPVPEPPALTLETSDAALREQLAEVGGGTISAPLLSQDDLVARTVGMIGGLSQGFVPSKIFRLPAPRGKFSTTVAGDRFYVDPDSYARYDGHARAIAATNVDTLASAFHRFRPLLEASYGEAGHRSADLDNALIRSLDLVLATPELSGPVPLERKEAMFVYADPDLEALPPLQKQLLRMGPDNVALIKAQASALRQALLAP